MSSFSTKRNLRLVILCQILAVGYLNVYLWSLSDSEDCYVKFTDGANGDWIRPFLRFGKLGHVSNCLLIMYYYISLASQCIVNILYCVYLLKSGKLLYLNVTKCIKCGPKCL